MVGICPCLPNSGKKILQDGMADRAPTPVIGAQDFLRTHAPAPAQGEAAEAALALVAAEDIAVAVVGVEGVPDGTVGVVEGVGADDNLAKQSTRVAGRDTTNSRTNSMRQLNHQHQLKVRLLQAPYAGHTAMQFPRYLRLLRESRGFDIVGTELSPRASHIENVYGKIRGFHEDYIVADFPESKALDSRQTLRVLPAHVRFLTPAQRQALGAAPSPAPPPSYFSNTQADTSYLGSRYPSFASPQLLRPHASSQAEEAKKAAKKEKKKKKKGLLSTLLGRKSKKGLQAAVDGLPSEVPEGVGALGTPDMAGLMTSAAAFSPGTPAGLQVGDVGAMRDDARLSKVLESMKQTLAATPVKPGASTMAGGMATTPTGFEVGAAQQHKDANVADMISFSPFVVKAANPVAAASAALASPRKDVSGAHYISDAGLDIYEATPLDEDAGFFRSPHHSTRLGRGRRMPEHVAKEELARQSRAGLRRYLNAATGVFADAAEQGQPRQALPPGDAAATFVPDVRYTGEVGLVAETLEARRTSGRGVAFEPDLEFSKVGAGLPREHQQPPQPPAPEPGSPHYLAQKGLVGPAGGGADGADDDDGSFVPNVRGEDSARLHPPAWRARRADRESRAAAPFSRYRRQEEQAALEGRVDTYIDSLKLEEIREWRHVGADGTSVVDSSREGADYASGASLSLPLGGSETSLPGGDHTKYDIVSDHILAQVEGLRVKTSKDAAVTTAARPVQTDALRTTPYPTLPSAGDMSNKAHMTRINKLARFTTDLALFYRRQVPPGTLTDEDSEHIASVAMKAFPAAGGARELLCRLCMEFPEGYQRGDLEWLLSHHLAEIYEDDLRQIFPDIEEVPPRDRIEDTTQYDPIRVRYPSRIFVMNHPSIASNRPYIRCENTVRREGLPLWYCASTKSTIMSKGGRWAVVSALQRVVLQAVYPHRQTSPLESFLWELPVEAEPDLTGHHPGLQLEVDTWRVDPAVYVFDGKGEPSYAHSLGGGGGGGGAAGLLGDEAGVATEEVAAAAGQRESATYGGEPTARFPLGVVRDPSLLQRSVRDLEGRGGGFEYLVPEVGMVGRYHPGGTVRVEALVKPTEARRGSGGGGGSRGRPRGSVAAAPPTAASAALDKNCLAFSLVGVPPSSGVTEAAAAAAAKKEEKKEKKKKRSTSSRKRGGSFVTSLFSSITSTLGPKKGDGKQAAAASAAAGDAKPLVVGYAGDTLMLKRDEAGYYVHFVSTGSEQRVYLPLTPFHVLGRLSKLCAAAGVKESFHAQWAVLRKLDYSEDPQGMPDSDDEDDDRYYGHEDSGGRGGHPGGRPGGYDDDDDGYYGPGDDVRRGAAPPRPGGRPLPPIPDEARRAARRAAARLGEDEDDEVPFDWVGGAEPPGGHGGEAADDDYYEDDDPPDPRRGGGLVTGEL